MIHVERRHKSPAAAQASIWSEDAEEVTFSRSSTKCPRRSAPRILEAPATTRKKVCPQKCVERTAHKNE